MMQQFDDITEQELMMGAWRMEMFLLTNEENSELILATFNSLLDSRAPADP